MTCQPDERAMTGVASRQRRQRTSSRHANVFASPPTSSRDPQDPLTRFDEICDTLTQDHVAGVPSGLKVGYASLSAERPEQRMRADDWGLRSAMHELVELTDLGVQVPPLTRTLLKGIHTRHRRGELKSTWTHSRMTAAYHDHVLARGLTSAKLLHGIDAVLSFRDIAPMGLPFFVYDDLSYDAWIAASRDPVEASSLLSITASTMRRCRERQLRTYESATGIVAMSHWFATSLIEETGVPADKVHVVYPGIPRGMDTPRTPYPPFARRAERYGDIPARGAFPPRRRLLFVTRMNHTWDFYRKGGDLVVEALALLRRHHDPQITLTVVGMEASPLPGPPPDGVRFIGRVPRNRLRALYDSHDLYVMPSRMEPFGLVFIEALSRGMPCIARNAYAMPEIVIPGLSGALVSGENPAELAATIASTLADDALYAVCSERAPDVSAYFSWERAAWQIAHVIARSLR